MTTTGRNPSDKSRTTRGKALTMLLGAGLGGGFLGALVLGIAWHVFERPAPEAAVTALKKRVATLDSQVAKQAQRPKDDGIAARLDAAVAKRDADVVARLDDMRALLETRLTAMKTQLGGDIARLDGAMADIAGSLESATRARSALAGKVDDALLQLAALQRRVKALEAQKAAARRAVHRGALAMALANLKAVVARGTPYDAEFDILRPLAPANDDMKLLGSHAASGVATPRRLAEEFRAVSQDALAAEARSRVDPDSMVDRFLANARSLVKVRRTVPGEGDDTGNHLARMHQHLSAGDLARAVAEGEKLSGPAHPVLAPWLARARARIAVDASLRRLQAALVRQGKPQPPRSHPG